MHERDASRKRKECRERRCCKSITTTAQMKIPDVDYFVIFQSAPNSYVFGAKG